MRTITIGGKELNMSFSMQAACLYERVTGHNPLDIQSEFVGKIENNLTMAACILQTSNEDAPDLNTLLKSLTASETTELLTATTAEIQSYFAPDATDKEDHENETSGN